MTFENKSDRMLHDMFKVIMDLLQSNDSNEVVADTLNHHSVDMATVYKHLMSQVRT